MQEEYAKSLVALAKELGADDAIPFNIEDIAFDARTILKCLYGCPGGLAYCPTTATEASNTLMFQQLIQKYKWGVLVRTSELGKGQDITIALESRAFRDGYTFAFGATECATCAQCATESGDPCVNRRNLRPPLYFLGIDVYKTVRGLGWTLEVVQQKGDPVSNITAVFVE
jgi:predicted metal-binding protein